tara:strand:+ start:786 stop:1142 length:357 start_codon:yes stop_codon:yes gene_type:complete
MPTGLNFKQAIIVAAIPSLIGIAATYYSQRVESNQAVVQARLMERDLISWEATVINIDKTKNFVHAYPIPISDNLAWEKYHTCRIDNKDTRFICASRQKDVHSDLTPEIIKEHVKFGF